MKADESKSYPEGHFVGLWMGIGIALFTAIAVPLCFLIDNFAFIGVGPAIGVSIGLAVGQGIEAKYKEAGQIRPATMAEHQKKKTAILLALAILVIGTVVLGTLLALFML